MNKLVKSREIYWCESDDRFVLVVREDGDIVGLNYMQGDDLEYFESNFNSIDKSLTKFYNSIENYLNGTTELDRINQAIWAHFAYENN
jgi:transcription termination factor NusB